MEINLNIDNNNIDEDFSRIASDLMNKWILLVENTQFRITELEFYYKCESHNDPFTHGHEQQRKSGKWYFHGSGIDLTFGTDEYYGGILIRAIFNLDTKMFIYGPLNIITEIFSSRESAYLSDFPFGLIEDVNEKITFEVPIRAPRVGLNPKNSLEMYNKLYRYLVMPKQKHAEKTKIAEAMRKFNYTEEKIKDIWG
jgi:hypothetical protein